MKHQIALIILLVLTGCTTTQNNNYNLPPGYTVLYVFDPAAGDPLEPSVLRELSQAAESGDIPAIIKLQGYYSTIGKSPRLARKYDNLLLKLEHPPALYDWAYNEWHDEDHPNLKRCLRYLRRAKELGHPVEPALIAEIEQALKTGIIPKRTRFRFIVEITSDSTVEPPPPPRRHPGPNR